MAACAENLVKVVVRIPVGFEETCTFIDENSAAGEEVPAAIGEMSAQVEEVTASTEELARLVKHLQQDVDQVSLISAVDESCPL